MRQRLEVRWQKAAAQPGSPRASRDTFEFAVVQLQPRMLLAGLKSRRFTSKALEVCRQDAPDAPLRSVPYAMPGDWLIASRMSPGSSFVRLVWQGLITDQKLGFFDRSQLVSLASFHHAEGLLSSLGGYFHYGLFCLNAFDGYEGGHGFKGGSFKNRVCLPFCVPIFEKFSFNRVPLKL